MGRASVCVCSSFHRQSGRTFLQLSLALLNPGEGKLPLLEGGAIDPLPDSLVGDAPRSALRESEGLPPVVERLLERMQVEVVCVESRREWIKERGTSGWSVIL